MQALVPRKSSSHPFMSALSAVSEKLWQSRASGDVSVSPNQVGGKVHGKAAEFLGGIRGMCFQRWVKEGKMEEGWPKKNKNIYIYIYIMNAVLR